MLDMLGNNYKSCFLHCLIKICPLSALMFLSAQLYIGAGLNVMGAALRWLSTAHPIVCSHVYNHSGFLVAMLGQVLTACAQPYITYSPTKLASFWFGAKERSLCTNFASVGEYLFHHLRCGR